MDTIDVLNEMTLFDFIVGGSTGEKTTSADDFMREVGKMLPKGTFSWVSKYRTLAKREILKVGTARRVNQRVRGYFVPTAEAPGLADRLKQIRAQFLQEMAEFLVQLPTIVENWANHPDNQKTTTGGVLRADLIRKHAPTRGDLAKVLSFEVSAVMLQQTNYFGEDDALKTEVSGLVGQAALEISEDVKKSWKGQAGGRTSSRVLGLIRRIRNKANAMSVLSDKFENLRKMCDDVLTSAPREGLIEGLDFLRICALLNFCSEPENVLADQAIQFDPMDVQVPTPAPSEATMRAEQLALDTVPDLEQLECGGPGSEPEADPDAEAEAEAEAQPSQGSASAQPAESGELVFEF
ncbi:DUF3150 domain-containing protein [Rubrivivax gelatinosus]|uniref:DUF3150 domain-containing protein n=1 Tax=Rubrivivax gelatinosus TaxID=28068 RepID=UPI000317A2F7|nr:DUF3150 domain-containing protein [Rubrivivax gelatinosus]MBG6082975.1 hypothetical protein [Rubrivivax gelatinosus]